MTIKALSSILPDFRALAAEEQPGTPRAVRAQKDLSPLEKQRLEEACAEFESLLINLLMKQMRKTVPKPELINGGMGEEIFTGMLDEEYARKMAFTQGTGLRSVLLEQLTGERGNSPPQGMVLERYGVHQPAPLPSADELVLPVTGRISSAYGWRKDPLTGERDFHHGIDIAGPAGSGVFAAGSGRVVFSGWKEGYGNMVEIDHGGTSTLYAHNDKNLVAEGEDVRQFQMVALMGETGRSTGPHLHYEVRKQGERVNPQTVTRMRNSALYAKRP